MRAFCLLLLVLVLMAGTTGCVATRAPQTIILPGYSHLHERMAQADERGPAPVVRAAVRRPHEARMQ